MYGNRMIVPLYLYIGNLTLYKTFNRDYSSPHTLNPDILNPLSIPNHPKKNSLPKVITQYTGTLNASNLYVQLSTATSSPTHSNVELFPCNHSGLIGH